MRALFRMLRGLIALVMLASALPATAALLTFDDLPGGGGSIPNGYGGFTWNSATAVGYIDGPGTLPGTGYATGAVSGVNVAFNDGGLNPTRIQRISGTFDLMRAWWTAAWDDQTLFFSGLLGGTTLYTGSVAVTTTSPVEFIFNWSGIDELRIVNSIEQSQWVLDNLEFTVPVSVIPLPAAAPLFAAGLGGLLLAGLRRRRALRA